MPTTFKRPAVKQSEFQVGWFGSSALVGCIVGTAFFWRLVPEARGRSPEEIEGMWRYVKGEDP